MKRNKIFCFTAATLLLLASCAKDNIKPAEEANTVANEKTTARYNETPSVANIIISTSSHTTFNSSTRSSNSALVPFEITVNLNGNTGGNLATVVTLPIIGDVTLTKSVGSSPQTVKLQGTIPSYLLSYIPNGTSVLTKTSISSNPGNVNTSNVNVQWVD